MTQAIATIRSSKVRADLVAILCASLFVAGAYLSGGMSSAVAASQSADSPTVIRSMPAAAFDGPVLLLPNH